MQSCTLLRSSAGGIPDPALICKTEQIRPSGLRCTALQKRKVARGPMYTHVDKVPLAQRPPLRLVSDDPMCDAIARAKFPEHPARRRPRHRPSPSMVPAISVHPPGLTVRQRHRWGPVDARGFRDIRHVIARLHMPCGSFVRPETEGLHEESRNA